MPWNVMNSLMRLSRLPDHWMLLGAGLFTTLAFLGLRERLQYLIDLTVIPDDEAESWDNNGPNPSDDDGTIKLSTLDALCHSTNYEIRAAAIAIICSQFIASESACAAVMADYRSNDPNRQHRAAQVLKLLSEHCGIISLDQLDSITFTRGDLFSQSTFPPPRHRMDSQETRRRRHREAMVLHEGDQPITQDNIIQRERSEAS